MQRSSLYFLASVLCFGCGDDGRNPGLGNVDGGPTSDARPIVDGGPIDVADGAVDSEGPDVELTSPTQPAANDYSSGALVTAEDLIVTCVATPNTDTLSIVDPTSVVISVIGTSTSLDVNAAPTANPNEYSASIDLADFANGALTVRCTASDLAEDPKTNSDDIATFLDLGPRIDIFNPVVDVSYGGAVAISFTVLPQPVDGSDTGAGVNVSSVEAYLSGFDISSALTSPSANVWTATVNFADSDLFGTTSLNGPVTLTVSAGNSRTTTAVTRSSSVVFTADEDGPGVTITSPGAGLLVSGIIQVVASVNDAAGVNEVTGTLDGIPFDMIDGGGGTWSALFDTRELEGIYPLLQVRAVDQVGNQATAGQVLALDNQPPIVNLDSAPVREATCVNLAGECWGEDIYECSTEFDPLGSDALSDGQTVPQLSEIRVRTEDRSNSALATTGVIIPIANVDPSTINLLVLDDISMALVVDTDGDDICDAINPLVEPTTTPLASNQAALISMQQISIGGAQRFVDSQSFGTAGVDYDGYCLDPIEDSGYPDELCVTTPLTRVISTSYNKSVPAIYGIPPVGGPSCLGNAFDSVASNMSDGWACMAAVAQDSLGNIGVSAPIRVCFDHDGDGFEDDGVTALSAQGCEDLYAFPPVALAGLRPECTDGCTFEPTRFEDVPERNILYRGTDTRECADLVDNDDDLNTDEDDGQCTAANDDDESTL